MAKVTITMNNDTRARFMSSGNELTFEVTPTVKMPTLEPVRTEAPMSQYQRRLVEILEARNANKPECKHGSRKADGSCPTKSYKRKRKCKYGRRIKGKCPGKPTSKPLKKTKKNPKKSKK
jgi:hypothetical protein